MSDLKVLLKDGRTLDFEDTIGHQIGNGAVQIVFSDGSQQVYNDFTEVHVIPTEEEKADFLRQGELAKERAEAAQLMQERVDKQVREDELEEPMKGEEVSPDGDAGEPTAH